jgi:uncharacterized protein with HEPN domain
MKMKTEERLESILMFAKRVQKNMNTATLSDFIVDEQMQDAILYRLGQIGEIAAKVPLEEQEKYPTIFWRQMIGLRHRLFHDYEEIDLTKVYEITQQPISQLIENIEKLLK